MQFCMKITILFESPVFSTTESGNPTPTSCWYAYTVPLEARYNEYTLHYYTISLLHYMHE